MRTLRLGAAGLGRGFTLMLPTLARDPRVKLVAAADPRPGARERFAADFGGRAYESAEALCADDDVEVIYVATPHQHHALVLSLQIVTLALLHLLKLPSFVYLAKSY